MGKVFEPSRLVGAPHAEVTALTDSAVPATEWIIGSIIPAGRRQRLIDIPSSVDLVRLVSTEAMSAAKSAMLRPCLRQAEDRPGYFRAEVQVPLPEELFDQLFNGRSGYRANYYLSPQQGAAFNRAMVTSITPAILEACTTAGFDPEDVEFTRLSLHGQYSKIWIVGDGQAFLASPAALIPERWASYWQGKDSSLGLRLPLPSIPQLDVKGTFIHPATKDAWVYEAKLHRDDDIHRTGWT